jgi:rRNA-processing protein EBP2
MVVVGDEEMCAPIPDINDDLQRETTFFERALASAEVAISRLKNLGVSVRRPDDFYAEMVKSDEHMKRVRAELIFEQTSQETREERRKAREQKRYGKQVQAEKLKERTLQKKDSIKSLDKWRKQRKRDGFEDNGSAPEGFEDEKRKKQGGGGGQHGRSTPETRDKKSFKDEKFGFGGRKRVRFSSFFRLRFSFRRSDDPRLA